MSVKYAAVKFQFAPRSVVVGLAVEGLHFKDGATSTAVSLPSQNFSESAGLIVKLLESMISEGDNLIIVTRSTTFEALEDIPRSIAVVTPYDQATTELLKVASTVSEEEAAAERERNPDPYTRVELKTLQNLPIDSGVFYTDASIAASQKGLGVFGWIRENPDLTALSFNIDSRRSAQSINALETLAIGDALLSNSKLDRITIYSDSRFSIKKFEELRDGGDGEGITHLFNNAQMSRMKKIFREADVRFVWVKAHDTSKWNIAIDQAVRSARNTVQVKEVDNVQFIRGNMESLMKNMLNSH